ncbi:MAG: hypothetical protein QOG85_835 [Gaiellaceae bacterium]|nr:hypothetical protein [Gaiellaceae bacterium]
MSFFGESFPTPEELAAIAKRRLAERTDSERKFHAILPHLLEARRSMREAAAHGCGGHLYDRARESLALLIDEIETVLVRPPV